VRDYRYLHESQQQPPLFQAIAGHDLGQVYNMERRVVRDPVIARLPSVKVIRPLTQVFKVVDIVAETSQAKDVLEVVPCHTPQPGMLSNQPSHDDAQCRGRYAPPTYRGQPPDQQ
jgi:hypothetical protein